VNRAKATALLLATLACAAAAPAEPPAAPLPRDSVYQLNARLTDQDGQSRPLGSLRGRPRVVALFYTSCKYVCPLIVERVRAIEKALAPRERERIGLVLITIDPRRDSPEVLGRLMTERRLDASHWTLLRPEPEDLRAIAGVLGFRYRELADGEFNHTTALVLLDAEGRILSRTDQVSGERDADFLASVRAAARSGLLPGNASDR